MRERFLRDRTGKIVVWQTPNPPLIAWAVLRVVNEVRPSPNIAWLGTALIFTWAYLELTSGVNYFRRLLGLAVLTSIIVTQFR